MVLGVFLFDNFSGFVGWMLGAFCRCFNDGKLKGYLWLDENGCFVRIFSEVIA